MLLRTFDMRGPLFEPGNEILSIGRIIVEPIVNFLPHHVLLLLLLPHLPLLILVVLGRSVTQYALLSLHLLLQKSLVLLFIQPSCIDISSIIALSSSFDNSLFGVLLLPITIATMTATIGFKVINNMPFSMQVHILVPSSLILMLILILIPPSHHRVTRLWTY